MLNVYESDFLNRRRTRRLFRSRFPRKLKQEKYDKSQKTLLALKFFLAVGCPFLGAKVLEGLFPSEVASNEHQAPVIRSSKDLPSAPKLVVTPELIEKQELVEVEQQKLPEVKQKLTETQQTQVEEDQQAKTELTAKVVIKEPETGIELLEVLGLRGKTALSVYGRPRIGEEQAWGSLGLSRTAEESWQLYKTRKEEVKQSTGMSDDDFALNIINPVFNAPIGPIKDEYIHKALELAPENQGLVAINFNRISKAKEAIQGLEFKKVIVEGEEKEFSKDLLQYLAVGLDIEHFENGKATASELNEFNTWFAQKHQEWAGDSSIPGLVIIYTWHGPITGKEYQGEIVNIGELKQYYLPEKTIVVTIFDGWGSKKAKLDKMVEIVNSFPFDPKNPSLLGVMGAEPMWGKKYDTATTKEVFETLDGAPVYFFAVQ